MFFALAIIIMMTAFLYICTFIVAWGCIRILDHASSSNIGDAGFLSAIMLTISIFVIYVGVMIRIFGPVLRFFVG